MTDFRTRLREAMPRRRASASASPIGPASDSGSRRRIVSGTIASISAARFAYPSAASIATWSFAAVPTWRAMKPSWSSRAARDSPGGGFMVMRSLRGGPPHRLDGRGPASGSGFGYQLRGRGGVHQVGELRGFARPQAEEPRSVGVLVDRLGSAGKGVVGSDDLARQRRVDVARRFHRFDDRTGLAGFHLAPRLGQVDVDQIAERRLRVVGDADRHCAVGLRAYPFVAVDVLEVGGNAHGGTPGKSCCG